MNIAPPKLHTSQIPIIRKQPNNHQSTHQPLRDPPPVIRNHQLSPATKIVFHSPQTYNNNHYLNHLIPNIAKQQKVRFTHQEAMSPLARPQNHNLVPSLLKKDFRFVPNNGNAPVNQGQSMIKIMAIGNASSAATRSRGISQISISTSQRPQVLLAHAINAEYRAPLSPFKVLMNAPVRRISKHSVTVSDEHRSNRSNSQNIHIKIESAQSSPPLPTLITVTQTTPLNPATIQYSEPTIALQAQNNHHIINSSIRNANLLNYNSNSNSNSNSNRHTNSNGDQIQNKYYRKQSQKARLQSQGTNKPSARLIRKLNDDQIKRGRIDSKSEERPLLTKSTFIQKLKLQMAESPGYHQVFQKPQANTSGYDYEGEREDKMQSGQLNHQKYYNSQYNNEYYNIQPSRVSNRSQQPGGQLQKGIWASIYKQKLYRSSHILVNQIFQNETHKALLKMNRIEMRSGSKSHRRRNNP